MKATVDGEPKSAVENSDHEQQKALLCWMGYIVRRSDSQPTNQPTRKTRLMFFLSPVNDCYNFGIV